MMQEFVTHINNGGATVSPEEQAFNIEQEGADIKVELHGIPTFAFDLTQIDTPFSSGVESGKTGCNYYYQSAAFEETTLGKFNYA